MILLSKLLIYFLCVYGLSFMLVYTSGPFDIFNKIRSIGGKISPKITELLSCMFCTPTWVGIVFSLLNIIFFPFYQFTPGFLIFGNIHWWPIILVIDMLSTPSVVHFMDVIETLIDTKSEK